MVRPHLRSLTFALGMLPLIGFIAVADLGAAEQSAAAPTAAPAAAPDLTQAQLVEEITQLGGIVKHEGDAPDGAIEGITFTYTHTAKMSPGGKPVPPYAVTDDLVRQMMQLPKLTSLELNMCPGITVAAMRHIGAKTQLVHLALPGARVNDAAMHELAGLTNLRYFRASVASAVTAAGWADLEGMTQLQTLLIAETSIGDKGMEHLKGLTQLREISLYGTPVTDAGAEVLKGLPNLTSVRCGPQMSKGMVAKLQAVLPTCRFWR